jgi:hypothetical protein
MPETAHEMTGLRHEMTEMAHQIAEIRREAIASQRLSI